MAEDINHTIADKPMPWDDDLDCSHYRESRVRRKVYRYKLISTDEDVNYQPNAEGQEAVIC